METEVASAQREAREPGIDVMTCGVMHSERDRVAGGESSRLSVMDNAVRGALRHFCSNDGSDIGPEHNTSAMVEHMKILPFRF